MSEALDRLLAVGRNPETLAAAAQADGRPVIGYMDETAPRELLLAAGALPFRLRGDPAQTGDELARYVDTLAPKGFSAARSHHVEHVDAALAWLLAGRGAWLDRLVVSNTRKAILLMQDKLARAAAHYPELRLPPIAILDRAQSAGFGSQLYNRDRVHAFRGALQGWYGRPIDTAALHAAIADENATRARLRRVRALRAATPPRLIGAEAMAFYAAAKTMPGAAFRTLADPALDGAEAREGRPGVRLFLAGSPLDHPAWAARIEAADAVIVGDDLAWGDAGAEPDVPLDGDPLEALIAHYEALQPLRQPLAAQIAHVTGVAQACGAQAAVIAVYRGDDIKAWEAPGQRDALVALGLATLHLKELPYAPGDDVTARVRGFLEQGDAPA